MTTTVKAADAAQFLAFVPRLLGYTPRRSIVLVPMGRGRSLGAMRLDLPPDGVRTGDGFAATAIGMVCRISDADAFLATVYTDESAEVALPHATLAEELRRAADASGLQVIDLLVVAGDGWGSHLDPPAVVQPLDALRVHDGETLPEAFGDQATGAELPEYSAGQRRSVGHADRTLRAALSVVCDLPSDLTARVGPAALEAACELDDPPRLFEKALRWDAGALSPMRVALLGWCLQRPALRDVALVQWSTDAVGGEDALQAQRRWEEGGEYPADLAAVMWGEGRRPEPERLERALLLVRHVAAMTAKRRRSGALAVCAWLSWALGRSTHADRYATMALDLDPRHGLAEIVRSFVAATHLPDWAFHHDGR